MQQYSSGARPKRDRHPPRHLDDYELDYASRRPQAKQYSSTVQYQHGREEDEYQPLEGATKMTSLTLHQTTPYLLRGEREREEQYGFYSFHKELELIREENSRLCESQLAIHKDFEQVRSLREDMRMLVETVHSLQEVKSPAASHTPTGSLNQPAVPGGWPNSPPPVHLRPAADEEEEEWPEPPPPWPEVEEQSPLSNAVSPLDKVMHEIRFNTTSGAATQSGLSAERALPSYRDTPFQGGLPHKDPGDEGPQYHPPQTSSTPIQRYPGL